MTQSQVRLERHEAEKKAGQRRFRVHRQKTAADQGRDEKAVLSMGRVHEHRWKSDKRRRIERGQIAAQDAIEDVTGPRQPRGERPEIGRKRQRRADHQRGRRIEEGGIAELRPEHRLLSRPVRADVIGEVRAAFERQARRRIEADKIGPDRLSFTIEAGGAERYPADGPEQRDREYNPLVDARAFGVEPGAVAQRICDPVD